MTGSGGTGTAGGASHEASPATNPDHWCQACGDPIPPDDYWSCVFVDQVAIAHVLCIPGMWMLWAPSRPATLAGQLLGGEIEDLWPARPDLALDGGAGQSQQRLFDLKELEDPR